MDEIMRSISRCTTTGLQYIEANLNKSIKTDHTGALCGGVLSLV